MLSDFLNGLEDFKREVNGTGGGAFLTECTAAGIQFVPDVESDRSPAPERQVNISYRGIGKNWTI